MAKARIKKTLTTVLRYGAARRTLTASGGGQTYSMDLPAVGPESGMLRETAMAIRDSAHQLSALAKTVCELHGITDQPSPAKAKAKAKA